MNLFFNWKLIFFKICVVYGENKGEIGGEKQVRDYWVYFNLCF